MKWFEQLPDSLLCEHRDLQGFIRLFLTGTPNTVRLNNRLIENANAKNYQSARLGPT